MCSTAVSTRHAWGGRWCAGCCTQTSFQRCDSSPALPRRFISNCDLVQGVPPALRSQAARIIGGKTALLARIDAANGNPTGEGRLQNTQCSSHDSLFP